MNVSTKPTTNTTWETAFERITLKYHTICCWLVITLNPLWGLSDYYTNRVHFTDFFVIRISIAVLTALLLGFRKKLAINSELFVFIPVVAIALQNAYMYSVMDIESLQKHTFAYIALFIGVAMLVLWRSFYSVILACITILSNIILFKIFSELRPSQVLANGGLLTFTVVIFMKFLIHTRYTLTKKELIARFALQDSNKQLSIQKDIIEEKNKSITDSINYAQKIQEAILPHYNSFKENFPESFILYKPKDIISGDFYWLNKKENSVLVAVADCTGHGVPGALMSMLGSTFLNEIVNEKQLTRPSAILFELRESIINILKQNEGNSESKDGMDIALCKIDLNTHTLTYSGAFNPLWIIKNEKLIELKANKFPIGTYLGERTKFEEHNLNLEKGDSIYLFTDGYADQFGGPDGKKFKYKNLQQLLLSINTKSMDDQKSILDTTINDWKNNIEQVDDILLLGIRV